MFVAEPSAVPGAPGVLSVVVIGVGLGFGVAVVLASALAGGGGPAWW